MASISKISSLLPNWEHTWKSGIRLTPSSPTSWSRIARMIRGYFPAGKPDRMDSYWCFRMPYWEGMMLRASSYGIGTTAIVPLMVPVTFPGYVVPIGLGEESTVVGKLWPTGRERPGAKHRRFWGAAIAPAQSKDAVWKIDSRILKNLKKQQQERMLQRLCTMRERDENWTSSPAAVLAVPFQVPLRKTP